MAYSLSKYHFLLWACLFLAFVLPRGTEAEWNEPPLEPGYGLSGLLKINLDFFEMAAATGGDFYFWAPGEFGTRAFPPPVASEPILLAYSQNGGMPGMWDFPVDPAITLLQVFLGSQRLDQARLFRPDGTLAMDGDPGLRVANFRHMLIVEAAEPEPGRWRLEASGAGAYSFSVRYLSSRRKLEELGFDALDLIDFSLVELRGRPGHEGYFPVKGPPRAGTEQLCRLSMSGEGDLESLDLVDSGGNLLASYDLAAPEGEAETMDREDERLFSCRVPGVPFRARAKGTDRDGYSFVRMTSGLVVPGESP